MATDTTEASLVSFLSFASIPAWLVKNADTVGVVMALMTIVMIGHHDSRRFVQTVAAKLMRRSRYGSMPSTTAKNKNNGKDSSSSSGGGSSTNVPTISGLYVHPVKSLRPVSLTCTKLDGRGFVNDRRFMLVWPTAPTATSSTTTTTPVPYKFLTQRQCPALATIDAALDIEQHTLTLTASTTKESVVVDTRMDQRGVVSTLQARI